MAARPHVPQFGQWDNQDNVPYTMAFDNARKGRIGGKLINPNDPQENPELFANMVTAASPQAANVPPPSKNRAQTPEANGRGGNPRQFAPSPARSDNFGNHKTTSGDSAHQQHSSHGLHSARPPRRSSGSEYSFERSPMHPAYQAKVGGRSNASPAWDGKNSLNDSSHGASAGKSHPKQSTRVDESPDRSAAVPKFGDWDESKPQEGDYTNIFNKVREERHQTPSHDDGTRRTPSSYRPTQTQKPDGSSKGCCFPFAKCFS